MARTDSANYHNACRRAIKRGMAALDKGFGGDEWQDKINFDMLEMWSVELCICGQTDAENRIGLDCLSGELGFYYSNIPFAKTITPYPNRSLILAKLWKEAITKRYLNKACHRYIIQSSNYVVSQVAV